MGKNTCLFFKIKRKTILKLVNPLWRVDTSNLNSLLVVTCNANCSLIRAQNCDSLVANATKNQVLVTRYLELVTSGRLTFFRQPFNLKGKRHYLWMKGTFYSNRYNKPNPRFFDHQLDHHVFEPVASLYKGTPK